MIYHSRYKNFEIVIQPSRKVLEDDGRVVIKPGKKIQFKNGVYETKDPKEISFLRNQKNLIGVDFWEIDPVELEKKKKAAELSKSIIEKIQNGEIDEKELEKLINKTNNQNTTPQTSNNTGNNQNQNAPAATNK